MAKEKTEQDLIQWLEKNSVTGAYDTTIDHPAQGTFVYLVWASGRDRDVADYKLDRAGYVVSVNYAREKFNSIPRSEVKVKDHVDPDTLIRPVERNSMR